MPELPEVETIKNALALAIDGARIESAEVFCDRFRIKTPNDFCKRIEGAKVIDVKRIAKYIVIGLDNGLSIIWHLGMSGRIKISDNIQKALEKHDHVLIKTDKAVLVYNDARRFGIITYIKTSEIGNFFKNTGFDPFDEKLDKKYLLEKLSNKRIPIKVALLDQSIINGIGNIYASEALYLARISPLRPANEVSESECGALIKAIKETLEKAIKAGGSTLRDYKKPDGSMGYFQNLHCVYNKTGQKCPDCVCDKGIIKITQAGRSTFYCPTLQK